MSLHLGLIVNPLAGLGGSRALKGSDGEAVRAIAREEDSDALSRAEKRAIRALEMLRDSEVRISAWGGPMGERTCTCAGLACEVAGRAAEYPPSASDTREAAAALRQAGVDLLLFAGGDGTARDVFDAIGESLPVLCIPAGVKMHSGVFAISPEAAGELLRKLAAGGLVGLHRCEVRDIDEEAFRHDRVRSRFYGELQVPGDTSYLQHTKVGGRESAELAAVDIAEWIVDNMGEDTLYLVGPGSTTAAVMERLGLPNTLLGVDAVRGGQLLLPDANEEQLLSLLAGQRSGAEILVTAIGGQGHIFGRGNQQFSPAVIRAVGLGNIRVLAAKSKISALEGRPLLVDTDDPDLDRELCGYREVVTGYDDRILYPVKTFERREPTV